jgi:hypothetical protein
MDTKHLEHIIPITTEDGTGLRKAEGHYKGSWKRRGGVGAYMMLCRKWDRLENRIESEEGGARQFDIFDHIMKDERGEGLIDDIRDLRRYLVLVEAEMRARGSVAAKSKHRDNASEHQPNGGCICNACVTKRALTEEPHCEKCECPDCCEARVARIRADAKAKEG